MFKFLSKKTQPRETEETTKVVLSELNDVIKAGDTTAGAELAQIYEVITKTDPSNHKKEPVSDGVKIALISAGTSLVSILAVIRHEELNAIASKALGLIIKPRI